MSAVRHSPLAYLAAPIALGLATVVAYPLHSIFPDTVGYTFLLFVAATAWVAGRGPGLVTAILAPLTLDYFYLPPLHTFGFNHEAATLMFPFLLFAMGAAWLSSVQAKAKQAQSALQQNQERFARILSNLPDLSWTVNQLGQILYVSPIAEAMTGFSPQEFCDRGVKLVWDRIHPEDLDRVLQAATELFNTGRPFDLEFRFRRRDGEWIWLNDRAIGTYRQANHVYADGVITDITPRKTAELELKSKTALLEAQINATIDGILVVDSLERRILQNRRFVEIFQFPQELVTSIEGEPTRKYAQSLMKDPAAFEAKFHYLHDHPMETISDEFELKDGRTLERYSSPVVDDVGTYYGRIWTFRDITERKAAEIELKSKTALLEAQVNSTIDGILVVDPIGRRVLQNRRFLEIFNLPPELQLNGNDSPARNHVASQVKDSKAILARMEDLYMHPMETSREEVELNDGRTLDRYSAPVVDDAGKCYGRIWTFRDITRRKRNEETMRQLSLAVEQSPAAVVITDPNANITYVNRKFTECTGYSFEEVAGKNPSILKSGHTSEIEYKTLWDTITRGEEWRGELQNRKKSGELYWEAATIAPIVNAAGEVTSFLALKEDITLRKLTEANLANAKISAEEAHRSLRAQHLALESERQILDALINNVPDFMYVKDTQSRFIVGNAETASAMRVDTPKDLVGKTDFDFLPPDMARGFYEDEQEVLRSGKPLYNREEICLDGNGKQIQILTTKVPIRDSKGKITGIAGVGRNITGRKQMENALREAEQKFRGIFDNAPVGIFQSTPEGRFLSVNSSMASIFGYDSPEEMISLVTHIDHQLYVASKDREDFKNRIATHGGVQNFECEGFRKDGTRIWLSMSVRGTVENGVVIRYEGMCGDITERRAMEAQLRQAQKLEGIGQLAAGIAHEINTPTQFVTDNLVFLQGAWSTSASLFEQYRSSIRSSTCALPYEVISSLEQREKEADLDFISTEVPRAIDQALDGVRRVARIVKAMKEFSHPDAADKVQLDLNKAIESTITVARNEWKYVADIETDFEAGLPLIVCYPGEINQVILNLVVNAAHAIKEKVAGSERGKITISTRSHDQYAEVAISDTGTGIPQSIQSRIYEPFFTTKEVGKGTGQGLALAHSVVVKKHHGKIWFDSEFGKGTTFFIDLPFEPECAEKEK